MAKAKLLRELKQESLPKPPGDTIDEQLRQIDALKKENGRLRHSLTQMNRQYDLLRKMYNDLRAARTRSPEDVRSTGEVLYTVRLGDTLSGIAAAHDVPFRELLRANGLNSASLLRAGQVLKIPK